MRKKRGANKEVALLRTLANKKSQPYSLRRLIRDLQEIEKNKIPTVGVTARPLSDNMYVWHANLRGPEGTPYEGGVFHLVMNFTSKYPTEPPTIMLSTAIPHPCVDGNIVRLDMLDPSRKGIYEGWTSAYSVQSILLQLQSFLFEVPANYKNNPQPVRDAVKAANELVLSDIGHKGPLSPWPPFTSREIETDLNNYKIKKTEKELIYEELVCFHTKLTIAETHLGVGLLISRLPRTGEIRAVEPTLDLISLKAFIKEQLRISLDNSKFTHWMPLYLGEKKPAVLYLARKALSMICKGSTRKFEPKFILEVFPKMMVTLTVSMMQQKEHTSLKALRTFYSFYRLFILLLDEHPEFYDQIDESLEKFKSDEKNRVKERTPNLGDMLSKLAVSKKFKWADIIGPYLEEQMDRQVFWMIKDIPELEKMEHDAELDEDRINASFKTTLVGYHLTLFYSVFIGRVVNREGRTREQLLKSTDDMYGRLSQGEEELIQRCCNEIRKVNDYYAYFKMLGIPFPSKKELFEAIKKSIKNSSRKGYHGPEDQLNALPEKNVMIEDYRKTKPDSLDSLKADGKLPDPADPRWRKAVVGRFPWVADYVEVLTEKEALNPATIAHISDEMKTSNMEVIQYNQGKKSIMGGQFHKLLEMTSYDEYSPSMSWMELFLKLEFENFMELFIHNPDFKKLYNYIDILAPHVSCLCLLIGPKKGIKSGYHWITAVLTKLPKLTALKLYSRGLYGISLEIIKCLQKGASNFVKTNGKLLKLEIDRVLMLCDQKLLLFFKTLPDLRVINMNQMSVTQPIASVLNKILTNFKNIQELDLVDCRMGVEAGKEIADGLMRAKQLEILRIAKNPSLGPSVVGIVYNLAFSPKVSLIDISEINLTSKANDVVESLYKLLSISGSLKVLNMNKTSINHVTSELFFKALGNNKTLTAICMNGSVFGKSANMGKALALNAKRNGSLEYVSIVGSIGSSGNLTGFIDSFWVSDRDEEHWYGDPQEASKMHGEQIERKFYCGLKELVLDMNQANFGHSANSLKHVKYVNYPKIIPFLCENKVLELLNLKNCNLNKGDSEVLCFGLKSEDFLSSVRILNLAHNNLRKEGAQALATNLSQDKTILEELDISRNNIGVAGAKALAKMLTVNKSLRVLNLFANAVDVDGARALKESFKVNTTLAKIDLGCNRLREKGVKELAEGLSLNNDSAIRTLGIRFNFISDDGITEFFNMAVFSKTCSLKHLYIKGNYYTELNIVDLQKKITENSIILHVDVFEKLKNLKQSQLERSIWISPIWANTQDAANKIKSFFEDHQKVGIVVDVRVRNGPKIPGRVKANIYAIVEFAHPNSVFRALRVASKKKAIIAGNRIKIYKAGSGVAVNVKPTSKHRR
eukprot:TRINITY_DN838_c0_g2_i4.p1 TRINITY_DN838_c0_g2~~TRINITY_DN838_c0_g2_i4.p1  ORF type:complete len:1376 (-),score=453.51 TRINITY_DN838_c0_g2_i4:170-4297(-)